MLTSTKPKAVKPQIVIIGAGPVGLWLAIQLSVKFKVLMLERRKFYVRSQSVFVDFNHVSNQQDADLHSLLAHIAEGGNKIAIQDFEQSLKAIAKKRGVGIRFKNVHDVQQDVLCKYTGSIVIACDGSRSSVRKQLFADKMRFKHDLQFAVTLKYETHKNTRELSMIKELYATLKVMGTVGLETIKRGALRATVIMSFYVPELWYKSVQKATFTKPIRIQDWPSLPDAFRRQLNFYINLRRCILKDTVFPGTVSVSAYPLTAQCSETLSAVRSCKGHRSPVFLAGDAAMALPYFRGLNNGLHCANRLSNLLSSGQSMDDVMKSYAQAVNEAATYELHHVKTKQLFFQNIGRLLKTINVLPFQINNWSTKLVDQLSSTDPDKHLVGVRSSDLNVVLSSISGKINILHDSARRFLAYRII